MKLLLFDIDQTLINTGGAGLCALDRACRNLFQLDNAMDGISPHGKTDPAIVREILRVKLSSGEPQHQRNPFDSESYVHSLKMKFRSRQLIAFCLEYFLY